MRAVACSSAGRGSGTRPSSGNGAGSSSSGGSSVEGPRPPAGGDISSAANPYVKHCVRLRESARYRQQLRRLLVAGGTLLCELAEAAGGTLEAVALFVKPGADVPGGVTCEAVITVSDAVMRKLTGLEETGGVHLAAELRMPPFVDLVQDSWQPHTQQHAAAGPGQAASSDQQQQPGVAQAAGTPAPHAGGSGGSTHPLQLQRLLVLDGVQDPGNMGTLLRCAAAFGWDAVWLLPGCCDPFNDKALRASRGAVFKCRLAEGGLQQLQQVAARHGLLLLAAEPDGAAQGGAVESAEGGDSSDSGSSNSSSSSSSSSRDQRGVALVLGSEGSGLSPGVLAAATPLAIPMAAGAMESLNVAVAGSILMFALSGGMARLAGRLQELRVVPPVG